MKLVDTKNKEAGPVHLPWDAGMEALAAGTFEAHPHDGERGPDMPMAQSPFPGTDPKDGTLQTADAKKTPNMTGVMAADAAASGLPKEPEPPEESTKPTKADPAK